MLWFAFEIFKIKEHLKSSYKNDNLTTFYKIYLLQNLSHIFYQANIINRHLIIIIATIIMFSEGC